jgi:transcriptional/translational regulatory protein YebC/TACO1
MLPQNTVPVEGGQAKQVIALVEALEELDDVQNVYANFDISESVLAEMA